MRAHDPDPLDQLQYYLIENVLGQMTVDSTGYVFYMPNLADAGSQVVTVVATDGVNETSCDITFNVPFCGCQFADIEIVSTGGAYAGSTQSVDIRAYCLTNSMEMSTFSIFL